MNRIAGLETEYGCLVQGGQDPGVAVCQVRDWFFEDRRHGLIDIHQRDWDEPSGNGGFLYNGGRLYMDMGHLEYCTPECKSLLDLIRYDRVGDYLVNQGAQQRAKVGSIDFIRNNIDHYSGATFGCHENYLVRRNAPLTESSVLSLLAFLTLRVLMIGAGRVIGESPENPWEMNPVDEALKSEQAPFQISQRANYINNDLFEWVQFNRAIINTRDEPLADGRRFRRLHLLHGDANVLTETQALKMGSTALVLDLLEAEALPNIYLANAVETLRTLSLEPDGDWLVPLADGRILPALEILHLYYNAALKEFGGRDEETVEVLKTWEATLDALSKRDFYKLFGKIDWVTKKILFEDFIEQEGISWQDPWLKSQDLEFHHVDDNRGLGRAVDSPGEYWAKALVNLPHSLDTPPQDTRANARGRALKAWSQIQPERYFVDWERLDSSNFGGFGLMDPFDANPAGFDHWLDLQKTTGAKDV
jgi:proteasome accessory factor A